MLFGLFRLIFGIAIFVILYFLIKKSHSKHKKLYLIINFFVSVAISTILALIPIENSFMTFSSLESVYDYTHIENIELVVNGEQTDFVVSTLMRNEYNYSIFPKTDKGWKIGMASDIKSVSTSLYGGASINVYRYKNSNDYYVSVYNSDGGPLEITDDRGSVFQSTEQTVYKLNQTYYIYYAYVNSLDDQYELIINGNTVKITDHLLH